MSRWQKAVLVHSELLTPNIKSLSFEVEGIKKYKSGQYFNIRLPEYPKSIRSFSTASSPEEKGILEFGIQLLNGGALSPKLFNLKKGQQVEISGPFGSFTWKSNNKKPLLLIAGGSGLVPFISMLRHHYNNYVKRKINLLISIKTAQELIYSNELKKMQQKDQDLQIELHLTKESNGRINQELLQKSIQIFKTAPLIYVCGSTAFTDNVYNMLLKLGVESKHIFRERFGPFIY